MARQQLFSMSWHSYHNSAVHSAADEVEKLDEKILNDPQLGGALEKIAKKYAVTAASLETTAGVAKPRKISRSGGQANVLDVPIPFTGDARSFELSPSYSNTVSAVEWQISGQQIIITVYDTEGAGREITDFIKLSNENLDRLREEMARYNGELLKTITQVADRRKTAIEERRKRDAGLPFKVDRG